MWCCKSHVVLTDADNQAIQLFNCEDVLVGNYLECGIVCNDADFHKCVALFRALITCIFLMTLAIHSFHSIHGSFVTVSKYFRKHGSMHSVHWGFRDRSLTLSTFSARVCSDSFVVYLEWYRGVSSAYIWILQLISCLEKLFMCGTIMVISVVTSSNDISLVWHSETPAYNRIFFTRL